MSKEAEVPEVVYRIVLKEDWEKAQESGSVPLAPIDERDGYVHMSCREEVAGTLSRYFEGKEVVVLALKAAELRAAGLRVQMDEVPHLGTSFPHAYGGPLPTSAATVAFSSASEAIEALK